MKKKIANTNNKSTIKIRLCEIYYIYLIMSIIQKMQCSNFFPYLQNVYINNINTYMTAPKSFYFIIIKRKGKFNTNTRRFHSPDVSPFICCSQIVTLLLYLNKKYTAEQTKGIQNDVNAHTCVN